MTMGCFEGAVVVYLYRLQALGELPTLDGPLSNDLILTELLREAASMFMIASVAWLSVGGLVPRVAQASIIFGIWDIIYYVFLRAIMGFPEGLLTWDVLFLIPSPWISPVLAPILVSIALTAGGFHALAREGTERPLRPSAAHWTVAIAGAAVVIASFIIATPDGFTGMNFPDSFPWAVFLAGLVIALGSYAHCAVRGRGGAVSA